MEIFSKNQNLLTYENKSIRKPKNMSDLEVNQNNPFSLFNQDMFEVSSASSESASHFQNKNSYSFQNTSQDIKSIEKENSFGYNKQLGHSLP
jgi:hypothetical protein